MMASIDELMRGKKPGKVKVTRENETWGPREWWAPYYRDRYNQWHGLDQDNNDFISTLESDFKLYTEPKKKIKRWLWATPKIPTTSTLSKAAVTRSLYSEEEIKENSGGNYSIKLPWSETEFDE